MTMMAPMRKKPFKVDLTKIEGEGDFPCPECGTLISPDDMSEEVYTILSIVANDDDVESVLLQCNKCNSIITLDGFTTISERTAEE